MNPNGSDLTTRYNNEPNIDALDGHEGLAEIEDYFALNLSDEEITKNLNSRINDSRVFWNDPSGFNLKNRRERNARYVIGDHWHDVPMGMNGVRYVQNEIFAAEQTIGAYVTDRIPEVEAMPATDTPEARQLASDVMGMLKFHAEENNLQDILVSVVNSLMNNYVAYIGLEWDEYAGENGDIKPYYIDPQNVIVDKRAKKGANPSFICVTEQKCAEELVAQFPSKEKEIYDKIGGKERKQAVVTYRKVYITYYESGKPMEGVVWYFEDLVLGKVKTTDWIYDEEVEGTRNILKAALKPVITFNFMNDGQHVIDRYSPIDQAIPLQLMVDRIGRQIQIGVSHASPVLVFSKQALPKPQADKVTGQPWEKILVDAKDVRAAHAVIQSNQVPNFVVDEIQRLAKLIHEMFGTPPQLRGETDNKQTATQDLMARGQAQGRQALIVRSLERGLTNYNRYLLQMMKVHYTEDHYAVVSGDDGRYDYIVINRNDIDDGLKIRFKAGSTLPNDKARMEAIALQLAKLNRISNLSLYEFLEVPNPGKHVERLVKDTVDPTITVEDIRKDDQDKNAVEDYEYIKAGMEAPPRDDVDMLHIATHNKQMLSNDFNDPEIWTPEMQMALRDHVQTEVDRIRALNGITDDQLYPQPAPTEQPPSASVGGNGNNMPPGMGGSAPGAPGASMPPALPNEAAPQAPSLSNPSVPPTV